MPERLSVYDWQRDAATALDEGTLGYLEGGAGDERALRETMAAFAADPAAAADARRHRGARPGDDGDRHAPPLPVIVAPVGHQRLFHPDGEVAVARAAAAPAW